MEGNQSEKILIIGFGEGTKNIIAQIKSKNYPGVQAFDFDSYDIFPEELYQMVILINPSPKDLNSLSKSFYQAGVLTLVISSKDFSTIDNCFDSFTKVPQSKILPTISGILEPLFHFGPISFDFNDISSTLKESGKFTIKTYQCNTSKNKIDEIVKNLKKDLVNLDIVKNRTFIINYNPSSNLPLTVDELIPLQTFFTSLPENINIKWGVQFDDSLDSNELQLSLIASGKVMKI